MYVTAVLALAMLAGIVWAIAAARANRRNSEKVICGGGYGELAFFCGKSIPEWFAKDMTGTVPEAAESEPPRCFVCLSVRDGRYRYPKKGETEKEYLMYLRKMEADDAALAREYEQLEADLSAPGPGPRRVEPVPRDSALRIGDDAGADVEHAAEEAAADAGKRRRT